MKTQHAFNSTISRASIISLLALLSNGAVHANLIYNGSFEDPDGPQPSNYQPIDAPSTAIPYWVVTQGEIDVSRSAAYQYFAEDGNFSIDLSGTPGPGAISQTLLTSVGAEYLVQFYFAGNPNGGPAIKTMEASAAGQSQIFTFDITGHSPTSVGWEPQSWSFVATDASTTLTFASLTSGDYGPVIDNVSVETVPEPNSVLAFGLAVLLLKHWRRGRIN